MEEFDLNAKTFQTRIQLKKDTDANWRAADPILLAGEVVYVETSSGEIRQKIGDGSKKYSQLAFMDEILRNQIPKKLSDLTNDNGPYIVNFTYFNNNWVCDKTIEEIYNVASEYKQLIIGVFQGPNGRIILNFVDGYLVENGKGVSFSGAGCVQDIDDEGNSYIITPDFIFLDYYNDTTTTSKIEISTDINSIKLKKLEFNTTAAPEADANIYVSDDGVIVSKLPFGQATYIEPNLNEQYVPKKYVDDKLAKAGSSANAVLYTEQSLTDAQKTQARTNIGALEESAYYVDITLTSQTTGTPNRTFAEMKAAYEAGMTLYVRMELDNETVMVPMVGISETTKHCFFQGAFQYKGVKQFISIGVQDNQAFATLAQLALALELDNLIPQNDIATELSSSNTDTQVPSAKCVYDSLTATDDKYLKLDGTSKMTGNLNVNNKNINNINILNVGTARIRSGGVQVPNTIYIETPAGNATANLACGTIQTPSITTVAESNGISFNSKSIKDLADPTDAQDAATKKYIDTKISAITSAQPKIYYVYLQDNGDDNYSVSMETGATSFTTYNELLAAKQNKMPIYCCINDTDVCFPLTPLDLASTDESMQLEGFYNSRIFTITFAQTAEGEVIVDEVIKKSEIVSTLSASSTDTEVPSAKCVYEVLAKVNELLSKM